MINQIRMETKDQGRVHEIYLYDPIGEGGFFFDAFSSKDMQEAIEEGESADEIHLRINSNGGNPFHAFAMYNLLKSCGKTIRTIVDGIAASAATVPAMAGDTVEMRTGSMLMIHEPSAPAYGTVSELEKTISSLKTITKSAIDVYAKKTGKSEQSLSKMMKDETWLTAQDAKNEGFADVVLEAPAMAMSISQESIDRMKTFLSPPESVMSLVRPVVTSPQQQKKENVLMKTKTTEEQPVSQNEAVTMSKEDLDSLISDAVSKAIAEANKQPEMSAEELEKQEAQKRETSIRSICKLAHLSETEADMFVKMGASVEEVRMTIMQKITMVNKPPKEGGDVPGSDENEKYRKEYRDAVSSGTRMQSSEEEYINSRRVSDGLEPLLAIN